MRSICLRSKLTCKDDIWMPGRQSPKEMPEHYRSYCKLLAEKVELFCGHNHFRFKTLPTSATKKKLQPSDEGITGYALIGGMEDTVYNVKDVGPGNKIARSPGRGGVCELYC